MNFNVTNGYPCNYSQGTNLNPNAKRKPENTVNQELVKPSDTQATPRDVLSALDIKGRQCWLSFNTEDPECEIPDEEAPL